MSMPMNIEKILPNPDILTKLKNVDEGSVLWIMNRAEEVQREYHRLEGPVSRTAFARGVDAVLTLSPLFKNSSRPLQKDTVRDSWVHTGNNIRKAILDYCAVFPENAAKAGLSATDLEDLNRASRDKILTRIPAPLPVVP